VTSIMYITYSPCKSSAGFQSDALKSSTV